jgi:hypothetical protein
MVEPLSVAIGIGIGIAALLAGTGLYLLGQKPDHIVNMREVSNYYRHVSANRALEQDIDDSE